MEGQSTSNASSKSLKMFNPFKKKKEDYFHLKMNYLYQAISCCKQGKDPSLFLKKKYKAEIKEEEAIGISKKLKIMAYGCENCIKLNDKIFTIEEALISMPLPNRDCTCILYKWEGKPGYCSCLFLGVTEQV